MTLNETLTKLIEKNENIFYAGNKSIIRANTISQKYERNIIILYSISEPITILKIFIENNGLKFNQRNFFQFRTKFRKLLVNHFNL